MKKAILAVSFGTSYADAEAACIRPVEAALARAFPDWEVRRAFTSRIIMKKLRRQGVEIDSETEALDKLRAQGYDEILLASTHIIPGHEYDLVRAAAEGLAISRPLLSDEEDLAWMAGLLAAIAEEEDRTLVVMGHGTDHAADETYAALRRKLPENVRLACVEGAHSLDEILPALENKLDKRITLMPLMLVAGDHARNDLAGDQEDSWKSRLTAEGFDVRMRMQGLGALDEVQKRFVQKVQVLMK